MKFIKITNEDYGAKHQGYHFDKSVKWEQDQELYDRLRSERGENWIGEKLDSFFDFDSDLYVDEHGEPYAAHEVMDVDGTFKPLYWWRLVNDDPGAVPAVVNEYGVKIAYNVAAELMDDEIREQLYNSQWWDSEQDFFDAYAKAHKEEYGEPWVLDDPHPQY